MQHNRGFKCTGGPWDGRMLYLHTPKTLMIRVMHWRGVYAATKPNSRHVKWEGTVEMSDSFKDEIDKAKKVTKDIGRAIEVVESATKSIKTVMSRHEHGFSISHYRRYFKHINGVEIPGTSEWVQVRCQHWSMGAKLFDIADETCTVLADPVGVPVDLP